MDESTDNSGLSAADWEAIISLSSDELLTWYSATHNQPIYGSSGVVINTPAGGATIGTSTILLLSLAGLIAYVVLR